MNRLMGLFRDGGVLLDEGPLHCEWTLNREANYLAKVVGFSV